MTDFVKLTYAQTGASQSVNAMGMRTMQARAYDERGSQYLLVKAPPASGKSRALMFIALDKIANQGVRKAIVAVPERSIGSSFKSTPLSKDGFFADWSVDPEWNLTSAGGAQKTKAFADFMQGQAKTLVCTHATLRYAFEQLGAQAFDNCLLAIDEFHHASADEESRLGELVRALVERDKAHIVAMTGSYFRGDAAPVLRPEDEARFNRVTEVEQDWARFKSSPQVDALFEAARIYARKVFAQLSATLVEESSEEALVKNREDFKELSPLGRAEVASFARDLVKVAPTVSQDVLSAAVQAVINLEKARGGAALLEKLTKLDETDIDGLDRLLSQWTVRDALSVLDEIDQRLAVIMAIEKLSGDETADELHTLHPLVTQARWLFGPEFDSSEYSSNVSLKTAAEKIFQKRVAKESFINAKQRPDIMVLADATCSIVGTEGFDAADPTLTRIQNVLIIELKKGRFAIGRDEMSQADGYVQDFLGSGALDGTPMFRAFVVGHEIAAKTVREKDLVEEKVLRGRVQAVTYGQLTRSAHQRLFRLKERIPARYEDVSGADLSARVMQMASQAPLALSSN